ncbi:hypothetical protein FACS1894172_09480 [Spirochaetia bacterium]|nr:hypothetical protein FACS1894172_09480 [Spirochaetia bacterium]
MKKLFAFFVFFGVTLWSYSQQNIGRYITECISYISESIPPIPNGFHRGDRTKYVNEDASTVL